DFPGGRLCFSIPRRTDRLASHARIDRRNGLCHAWADWLDCRWCVGDYGNLDRLFHIPQPKDGSRGRRELLAVSVAPAHRRHLDWLPFPLAAVFRELHGCTGCRWFGGLRAGCVDDVSGYREALAGHVLGNTVRPSQTPKRVAVGRRSCDT